jgi:hypothetical protein
MTDEMKEAIDELCDWLDYDVWTDAPVGLEKAVQRVNAERIRELVREQRARNEAVAVMAAKL